MISFFLADISYQLRSRLLLRHWLLKTINKEGYQPGDINIILCSDEYLYKLNVQYLNHRTYTDIITFDSSSGKELSGELYISLDRVRDNAREQKVSVSDELHRVMIHGILHLCGYKDKTSISKKRMSEREDYYLKRRGF
jgi:rRNA maturation RNase YbeY